MLAHPQALIGSVDEMTDKLLMIREEKGISYMTFRPANIKEYNLFANKIIPMLS